MNEYEIQERFLNIKTKNQEFKELFNNASKNLANLFYIRLIVDQDSLKINFDHKNNKIDSISMYGTPDKDDHNEYSDVKKGKSLSYNDFIENLVRKAHLKRGLTFVDYIPSNLKKAEVVISDFFDNPKMSITYFTSPLMLSINFNKNGTNIVYVLNNSESNIMMLDININNNSEIISTEVYFNHEKSHENEMITLTYEQLDYLIVLAHYSNGEEIVFNVEKYFDDILKNNYQDLIDYIKVKEMIYI